MIRRTNLKICVYDRVYGSVRKGIDASIFKEKAQPIGPCVNPVRYKDDEHEDPDRHRPFDRCQGQADHLSGLVEHALKNHASRLTRAEVHLSDVNAGNPGPEDMRCIIEVRPEVHQPMAATDNADSFDGAARDTVDKAMRMLDSSLGSAG